MEKRKKSKIIYKNNIKYPVNRDGHFVGFTEAVDLNAAKEKVKKLSNELDIVLEIYHPRPRK
jgi:hypothetical protein